jgi:hypothetical protein
MLQLLLCVVRTIKLHLTSFVFFKFSFFCSQFFEIFVPSFILFVLFSCVNCVFCNVYYYLCNSYELFLYLVLQMLFFLILKVVMLTSNSMPYQLTNIDFFGSSFNDNGFVVVH